MINNHFDFRWALCILGIISVLSVSGCATSENETSFELVSTEYPEQKEDNALTVEADRSEPVYVYVCGHVNRAGVYAVSENTRIYEVLNLAGGAGEDADISGINQAEKVSDGQQIYVPSREEMQQARSEGQTLQQTFTGTGGTEKDDGLVNINTADSAELQTLTGIGASRAQAIIDYRNENGSFERIEDIMNVTGIKDGMFSKIQDQIKVR